jgi:aryl carrier-like protein
MVPGLVVELAGLPLTASGKLDRKALPEPVPQPPASPVAPRTATERVLAGIWVEVLGLDAVGVEDDLYTLGGDSIMAMRIVARARQAGFRLSAAQVLRHPTIAGLAAVVHPAPAAGPEMAAASGPAGPPLTPEQLDAVKAELASAVEEPE